MPNVPYLSTEDRKTQIITQKHLDSSQEIYSAGCASQVWSCYPQKTLILENSQNWSLLARMALFSRFFSMKWPKKLQKVKNAADSDLAGVWIAFQMQKILRWQS